MYRRRPNTCTERRHAPSIRVSTLLVRVFVLACACFACAARARAGELAAPYVPTAPSVVERMFQIAKVGPQDFVIDLGSGDGRINITSAETYGARGVGIEIDPARLLKARENARAAGVSEEGDLRRCRSFHRRSLAGDCRHDLSAQPCNHEVARQVAQPEARHAHRVACRVHGRVAGRSFRDV